MTEDQQSEPIGQESAVARASRLFVKATSAVVVVIAVAVFFSRQFVLSELINSFRFQIALALIFLAVLLFYCRFRLWAALQLVLAGALLFPIVATLLQSSPAEVDHSDSISLLSFNVLGDNPDRSPVFELIKEQFADITVVIEYENRWIDALKPLESIYAHHVLEERWHGFGIAVFSRFPLRNVQVAETTGESDIPCVIAETTIRDQQFILAAVHFLAPLDRVRMDIRNGQLQQMAELIDAYRGERDLPVVVVGDFNCVPWSPFAKDFAKATGLIDSRLGQFYQGSWPTDNLLVQIPIDHAYVSPTVQIRKRSLLPASTSDHFPLYLEFAVPKSESSEPAGR